MCFKKFFFAVLFLPMLLCKAKAQTITYSSLFDNSTFSRSIDLSKPVGAIAGAAGTTPSGAATYTIPITCPPGTNGLVPQIAIVYNSQGGNGILGQGWSLSGLSTITRAGKDFYHDGKAGPATYTNDDAFVLDGQRLVPTMGSNGGDGTTYATEAESYSVTTSIGTIGSDPHRFVVRAKDGSIMEYGFSDDARVTSDDGSRIMVWRLNKIQDINGNYIWFYYSNENRESRLVKIAYTGNVAAGISPYNEINFQYAKRSDINITYDNGTYFNAQQLLWQIQVLGEGEVFKTWQFEYGKNDIGVSYLKMVEEFAADNSKLNDTRFKYGDESSIAVNETSSSDADISNTENDVYSGDFNGDGFSDLLVAVKAVEPFTNLPFTIGFKVKIFNSATNVYTTTETVNLGASGYSYIDKVPYANNVFALSPTDVNGDGVEDIILAKTHNTASGSDVKKYLDEIVVYYMNTSGSIASTSSFPAPSGFNIINPTYNYFFTGDFNGDGRTDFFTVLSNSYGYEIFYTSPSDGVVNKMVDVPGSLYAYKGSPIFFNALKVVVINMDGDSKADLIVVNKPDGATPGKSSLYTFGFSGSSVSINTIKADMDYPNSWHDIYFGDFNGDGKTDILTCPNPPTASYSYWELACSDGKAFRWETTLSAGHLIKQNFYYGSSGTDNIVIGDFNGDGKSDVYDCYYNGSTAQHRIYYSLGRSFTLKSQSTSRYWGKLAPGDYNGDGRVDLLDYHGAKTAQFNFFQPHLKSHLLEKVTDGYNRTTAFTYEPLTKGTGTGAFYVKGSGETYPVNNVQYPLYVATSMKQPDGIGGDDLTWYGYENLRMHRAGRGLLGFEKVKSYNVTTSMHSQAAYELNRDFYVPYLKTTKTFPESDYSKYTLATTNHDFTRIGSGYRFKQTNPTGNTEDMLSGRSSSYTNTYDADGNITRSESTLSGGVTITTLTESEYIAVGGAARPNAPSYITVTTTRNAKPSVMDKTRLEYDTRGRLIESTTNPNGVITAYSLFKSWEYDGYGNKTKDRAFSIGLHCPETKYEYDSKGRFVTKSSSNSGDFAEYAVHKFWGKPLSVTGITGLVSTSTYDAWGRLVSETVPVSSTAHYTVTYSDAWDIGSGHLYRTLVQHPAAPDIKTWYDAMGRPVKKQQEHSSGAWTTATTTYTARGSVAQKTNEYLPAETPLTTAYTYDEWNRIKTETSVAGTTSYQYDFSAGAALTTITLPDGKVKKTKTDASGKLVESDNVWLVPCSSTTTAGAMSCMPA